MRLAFKAAKGQLGEGRWRPRSRLPSAGGPMFPGLAKPRGDTPAVPSLGACVEAARPCFLPSHNWHPITPRCPSRWDGRAWHSTGFMQSGAAEHAGGAVLLKENGNIFTSEKRSTQKSCRERNEPEGSLRCAWGRYVRLTVQFSFRAIFFMPPLSELILSNHPAQNQNH